MNRPYVSAIDMKDYAEIHEGITAVQKSVGWFNHKGAKVLARYPQQIWGYGSAVQALISMYNERIPELEILDVGSGRGALGPTLALAYNAKVTECEPDKDAREDRDLVNGILQLAGRRTLTVWKNDIANLPMIEYDAVFCLCVIEQVVDESSAWIQLAQRVKKNGLLFITTNCGDVPNCHKFSSDEVKHRVDVLKDYGFMPMGQPDLGNMRQSSFRMGMMRI
jgi:hypothetical protein